MASGDNQCAKSKRCVCDIRLDGRLVLITGGNTGIGFYVARDLASKGAHVVMACHSAYRAKVAVEKIIEETGNNSVEYEVMDLESLQSVRQFAEKFSKKYSKLDILLNNAGRSMAPTLTEDGFDVHFQINHLGHFLLTNLLLDNLKRADQGRIINITSVVYHFGRLQWDKLRTAIRPGGLAYADSRLCAILFTRELCKRLDGTKVTANCFHPGIVDSEIARDSYLLQGFFNIAKLFNLSYLKTAEEGAQTSIHLCVCPELSDVSGAYFSDCAAVEPLAKARNDEDAARLWKVCSEFVGITS